MRSNVYGLYLRIYGPFLFNYLCFEEYSDHDFRSWKLPYVLSYLYMYRFSTTFD